MPNGEFISKQSIDRKNLINGTAKMVTDMPLTRDFPYWGERFEVRQKQYKETENRSKDIVIQFDEEPIINIVGDWHTGHPETDHQRINNEVKICLETPNSYMMVFGDGVDGMWWNPGQMEQVEQPPEQYQYLNSIFKALGEKGKLLVVGGGDHDGWAKKMGIDPYAEFSQKYGAYYTQGVACVTLRVGEIDYKLVGAHRLPGFSMYNNVHAEMRLSKELQGADIYVGAHNHVKGYSEQDIQQVDGDRLVSFISVGPYKKSDDYSRKKGFVEKSENGMYGCAIKLYKDHRQVKYYSSILEGNGKRLDRIEKGWIV